MTNTTVHCVIMKDYSLHNVTKSVYCQQEMDHTFV